MKRHVLVALVGALAVGCGGGGGGSSGSSLVSGAVPAPPPAPSPPPPPAPSPPPPPPPATTPTWTLVQADGAAGAPAARCNHAAAFDGTRLLVFGGLAADGTGKANNELLAFDPLTKGWTVLSASGAAGAPPARQWTHMVWADTRLLVFGGLGASGELNDTWEWTPANGWNQLTLDGAAGSPVGRDSGALVWDGTRAILFGGIDPTQTQVNDLWWFDPSAKTWTQMIANNVAGSPVKRSSHRLEWTGSKVLLFSGANPNGPFNDTWSYDSTTNAWTQLLADGLAGNPPVDAARSMKSAWIQGELVVATWQNTTSTIEFWGYSPGSNAWTKHLVTTNPGPLRFNFSFTSTGTKALFFAGIDSSYHNDVYVYAP